MLRRILRVWLIQSGRQGYQQRGQNHGSRYRNDSGQSNSGPSGSDGSDRDPYAVLGVKPGASREEIQTAYKKALQQYHPDKVSHLGKDLQDLANRKTQEIQRAYEKLRRA